MQLKNRLEKLHGKSWMYKAYVHKVIRTKVNEDTFQIVTDRDWFTFLLEKADEILKEFLPVAEGNAKQETSTALVGPGDQLPVKMLSESLTSAMKKLDSDKPLSDVEMKKLSQMNKTAQTFINLGKLQLDIHKAMKG